jgi:hypothetical protein
MDNKARTSTSGLLVSIAAILVWIGAYYSDVRNVPVIAPWLDWIADRLYGMLPILKHLAPQAAMSASATAVALIFFLAASVLVACFSRPGSATDKIERQLKTRGDKAKHRAGIKVR